MLPIGIMRVDTECNCTHGYLFRLQRNKRSISKMFSDNQYGGRDQALAAACSFREQQLAAIPALPLSQYCEILKKNNRSGLVGVSRHYLKLRSGRRSAYWYARCPLGLSKTRVLKFSVNKLGDDLARDLAIAARKGAIAELAQTGEVFMPFV